MKKKQFKKLVKESVKEVLQEELKTILREAVFGEGALQDIIAESVSGVVKGSGGSLSRSSTGQGSTQRRQNKTPQNGAQQPEAKLGENFKKMFNGEDITKGTDPAPQPSQPVNQQAGGANQMGGGASKIKQLEAQARQMKGQGAGMAATNQQPQNMEQLRETKQAQQGGQEFNRDNPGGRMRANPDLAEKLKGEGQASKRAIKKFMEKQQGG